jgi:hypothetical protein
MQPGRTRPWPYRATRRGGISDRRDSPRPSGGLLAQREGLLIGQSPSEGPGPRIILPGAIPISSGCGGRAPQDANIVNPGR